MTSYLLLHGAGSDAWVWHRVVPLLRERGHETITPDLPVDDEAAGLDAYARVAADAAGGHPDLVVVAQSLAGFVGPLVCDRLPASLLVLLNAMIPRPGESAGQWWEATGSEPARRAQDVLEGRDPDAPFDPRTTFLHDLPPEALAEALRRPPREQAARIFEDPWPLPAWPAVPTRVLVARQDRFFPADFQRRVARDRLGITPDEMDGGHLALLSRPAELVALLEEFRAGAAQAAVSHP